MPDNDNSEADGEKLELYCTGNWDDDPQSLNDIMPLKPRYRR